MSRRWTRSVFLACAGLVGTPSCGGGSTADADEGRDVPDEVMSEADAAGEADTAGEAEAEVEVVVPDVPCTGCWSGAACEPGDTVAACGIGGAACVSCDDGNPCTDDACSAGACANVPNDAATCPGGTCHGGACCSGCWDGTACRAGEEVAACGAAGAACEACEEDSNPCTAAACVAGACANPPDDAATCPGGTCHGGDCCTSCWDGTRCREGTDFTACGRDGAACVSCEDHNECTYDECSSSACVHYPLSGSTCTGGFCHGDICCTGCWDGTACFAGPSVVETRQLTCSGVEFVSLTLESLGQSFRVPRDGVLAGIEIRATAVTGVHTLSLSLYEETATGLVLLDTSSTARETTAACVTADVVGPTYFELGCIPVRAAQTYRFVLGGGERCSPCFSFRCCGGDGLRCDGDYQCVWRVSTAGNVYAGGTMYRGAAAQTGDLAFKIFMLP